MTNNRERLTRVFSKVFGLNRIDETVSIATLDVWDSSAQIALILELEDEFGIQVPNDDIIEMTSVPEILQFLSRNAGI